MKSPLPRSVVGFTLLLTFSSSTSLTLFADNLSRQSPFVGTSGSGTVAAPITENSPLELRGIMTTSTGNVFGLFDPAKRQGGWVRVNETGNDFTVRSYDPSSDAVTVEYQGRMLTLALKTAKINTLAPSAMQPPQMASIGPRPPMSVPAPNANNLNPTPTDEARRLETVAAEVRRRRALRQAASQQPGVPPPNGQLPPPGSGPQPGVQPGTQPGVPPRTMPGQTR